MRKVTIALVITCVILAFFALSFYLYSIEMTNKHDSLVDEYNELVDEYNQLVDRYNQVLENIELMIVEFAENLTEALEGAKFPPYTLIENENVVWVFRQSDEDLVIWTMPLETYMHYATKPKPQEYHRLRTDDGRTFTVRKMELFVQAEFFETVIPSLTEGRDDRAFVAEVFNLRRQLTVYRTDITDTPLWPAETMTTGAGDCEDFAILMVSLLVAGNEQANYGMQIEMIYMDANNPTEPQGVNHIMSFVRYADNSIAFVDSTASVMNPFDSPINGWYFEV